MFKDDVENRRGLGIKPGLKRIQSCLSFLNNPQKKYKSVLVTGTNGKGSVTFFLSNLACKFSDYRVARYISPHLISWNERFVINEKPVDSLYLEEFSYNLLKKIEEFESRSNMGKLTTFEVYTVIAFSLFAKEKVDIAFMEIGMGGRFDAVNVVNSKDVLCSVITNVSLEHMDYLGDSIEKIAYEKAGIIKEDNTTVTAGTDSALNVIKNEARKLNSNLTVLEQFDKNTLYPEKNIEAALAVWNIISDKIQIKRDSFKERGFLKSLQFPGRFQLIKDHNILLDGAHNPAGAIELRKMLDKYYPGGKIIYILGMLDKDFKGFADNLIPENSSVICTEPKSKRATEKNRLSDYLLENKCNPFKSKDLIEAVEIANGLEHDLIVITGSLYLVGEALSLIKEGKIRSYVANSDGRN